MGRPKEHGRETAAQLLQAAGRILALEGADSLTVRRLADEVGTTTRAVYSLFGGKDGLLSAMYRQMADTLVARHMAVPKESNVVAELLGLALAYRASALEHPNLYPLIFGTPVPGFTPQPAAVRHARGAFGRVEETIQRGIAEGQLVGRDRQTIAYALWALVHGLASLELASALGSQDQGEALWRDAVSGLVQAFTREPSTSRISLPRRKR